METILGIDLGTTNSEVAVIRNGKAEVLCEDGEAILPSVVGRDAAGGLLVGAAARNQWLLAPDRTVRSIKRRMGTAETVRMGDREYTPQEISAFILQTLKQRAEKQLGLPVRKAVITVPAFFNENQREATREAGELAGLEVVRIVNEPTAASLTYDPHPAKLERLLVYDLGGGTFDVSLVQIEGGVVEVLASHGDTHLGGDDFDQLLLDCVCGDFQREHGIDLRQSAAAKARMLKSVEEAKKRLSTEAVTRIEEEFIAEAQGKPLHLRRELRRSDYEELIRPLLDRTLRCVDASMTDAKVNANQIDKVVLVGGSSRTPLVQRLLEEQLGQPVHAEVDPDLCVAMGAAIQGGLIAGIDVGPVLVDITPHTLGIQALGMREGRPSSFCFAPLIARNSPLPCRRSEMFATASEGQELVHIVVFQGEDDDVRHNDRVGDFHLDGLAAVDAGNEILVEFELNLDGILQVRATEQATGRQRELTIDNAVSRFRMARQTAAAAEAAAGRAPADASVGPATLEAASGPAAEDTSPADVALAASRPAASGSPDERLTAEMTELLDRCERLLAKGEKLAGQTNPTDAAELRRLVAELRQAAQGRSPGDIERGLAELEDLVFYVEDA